MKFKGVIPVLILSVSLLSGCGSKTAATQKTVEKPVAVSVSNIQKTKIANVRTVVGKVKPAQEIAVVPKTPGKVSQVLVDIGQNVRKGQTLFTLEEKDANLQVSQASSALGTAKANLDRTSGGAMELQVAQLRSSLSTAELNMNDAKTAHENNKKLFEIGAASKQSLEASELRYNTAVEQYNTAKKAYDLTISQINNESIAAVEAQVRQAQVSYDQAKSQLENTVITAPIDGIVSARSIEVGSMASSAAAALTIVDISSVTVEISVLEEIANNLSVGSKSEIYIKSVGDKPYTGEVISISPNADARTQTYLVRFSVQNPDGKLKGGMLADVKVNTAVKNNVLAVPIDAVVDENGKKVIYLLNGEEASRKEVTVGASDEKLLEISGDIKENDKVIIKGQNFVKDKTKVTVVN